MSGSTTNSKSPLSIVAFVLGLVALGNLLLSGLFIASLIFVVLALFSVPTAFITGAIAVILGIVSLVKLKRADVKAVLGIVFGLLSVVVTVGIIVNLIISNVHSNQRATTSQSLMDEVDAYQQENGVFPSYDEVAPLLESKDMLPESFGAKGSDYSKDYYYELSCESTTRSHLIGDYGHTVIIAKIYYFSGYGEGKVYESVSSKASIPYDAQPSVDCGEDY